MYKRLIVTFGCVLIYYWVEAVAFTQCAFNGIDTGSYANSVKPFSTKDQERETKTKLRFSMNYPITSYVGIGDIKLGMSRDDVRKILGSEPTVIRRFEGSEPEDRFNDLGLFVYYNDKGRCKAVEIVLPALPIFEGKSLLETSFSELVQTFKKLDTEVEQDDSGLTSYKYGIGLYAPLLKEYPNSPPESAIIFEKGYYGPK